MKLLRSINTGWDRPAWVVACALLVLLCDFCLSPWCSVAVAAEENSTVAEPWSAEQLDFFESKIRPVLATHCYECHAVDAKTVRGGLLLDHREGVVRGGDSGPVVDPASPAESLLLRALRYTDEVANMPPAGPLPAETIADIERWIAMGVPDPRQRKSQVVAEVPSAEAWRAHWAFQPLRQPPVTNAADLPADLQQMTSSEVDRFIVARQRAAGIMPGTPADPRVLVRRVTYDLIGLPPSYERVERLVAEWSDESYARYVDELLASPQFGERWARHWLDVMRYADTKGYVFQEDRNLPDAYRYRDWVIRSWNDDMPYNQFVKLQLAADQLVQSPEDPHRSAMGFLTLGRRFLNNRHDIIDDRIDVMCRGLMGLTVACARCHDHKYDPIPIADYYSLYGVFANTRSDGKESLVLLDVEQPEDVPILLRGSPGNRGPIVPRQFLGMLAGSERKPFQRGSGRLELAEAITDDANPLTPRVFVNRVWGHLFGDYLVDTPSDFGIRSDPPKLPEVLDCLAWDFVNSGWSRKQLIRQLVLSRVYRQASDHRDEAYAIDPENRLYWKMNRRRLDFESMRDSLMSVAGRLEVEPIGGASVHIDQSPYPMRRTLYAFIDRQNLPGTFRTFDMANPDTHAPRRLETVVPQQALFLMNNSFAMEMAESLAHDTLQFAQNAGKSSDPSTLDEALIMLFRRVLRRDPAVDELDWMREYLAVEHDTSGATSDATDGVVPQWQYGVGTLDLAGGEITSFQSLPHWTGSAYQASAQLPDPALGWVMLSAKGGHPGGGLERVAVRRLVVPSIGTLRLRGRLQHRSAEGDGIRGHLLVTGRGSVWNDSVHNRESELDIPEIEVSAGQVIDFVVDSITDESHDSFEWPVRLTLRSADGGDQRLKSEEVFAAPAPPPLDPWARLAQVLMLSNEFLMLD